MTTTYVVQNSGGFGKYGKLNVNHAPIFYPVNFQMNVFDSVILKKSKESG